MSLSLIVLTDPNAGPAGDGSSPLHIIAAIGLLSSLQFGVFLDVNQAQEASPSDFSPPINHSAHLTQTCLRAFLGDMTAFNPLAYCDFGSLEILDA